MKPAPLLVLNLPASRPKPWKPLSENSRTSSRRRQHGSALYELSALTVVGARVTRQSSRDARHARRKNMIRTIVSTDDSIATVILRLVLGVVFFAEGAQKMLGWFGGSGFAGTMGFFTGTMHIPAPWAFLPIGAEFFGSMGLIIGFMTL